MTEDRAGLAIKPAPEHPSAALGPDGRPRWSSEKGPVVGGERHLLMIRYLLDVLERRYAADPNVYVAGDFKLYLDPRDPSRWVGPDVLLAFGVPKGPAAERMSYLPWVEGKVPDVVFEVASARTKKKDLGGPEPGRQEPEARVGSPWQR